MIRNVLLLLAVFSLSLGIPLQVALAAQMAYMSINIEGVEIEGDSTVSSMDREGTIEVHQLSYEVVAPRDAASGLPTGKRQHKPLTIKKRIDKSTPFLFKALVNNESVTKVLIRFFRPSPSGNGAEEHFYTIKLEDAHIVGIKTILPDALDQATMNRPVEEEVSFVFGKITWTFEIGGIEASDDWRRE